MRFFPPEWYPQSMVQLTFPHPNSDWQDDFELVVPCFVEIVNTIARYEKVILVGHDIKTVKSHFDPLHKNIILVE